MTSGLQKGELIIIAARPSMGKTALAINIAQNCRGASWRHCGHLQPGNEQESLLRRMLASQASVDQRRLQTGFLGREEQEKLQDALSLLVESHIFIDDSAGASIAEMRAKARRLKQNAGGLDLIMIDYLQLMSAIAAGGRTQEAMRTASRKSRPSRAASKPWPRSSRFPSSRSPSSRATTRARRQAPHAERSARVGLH